MVPHSLALLLLLAAAGARAEWNPAEVELEVAFEEESERAAAYEDLVLKYAPYLRFHKLEGLDDFCFPHNASDYFRVRDADDWSRQCNMDYATIHADEVPTYWHAMECGRHLHIAYWSFYGYNHNCDCCSGERNAWWEFLVVKVREWSTNPHMHEVMFGQKEGWYTRIAGNYELHDESHPVAYVGRAGHGFYHDSGGSNTCCYYEDTRNPGEPDHYMMTWHNLVELRKDEYGEDWMLEPGTHHWSGLQVPTFRDNWDLCNLAGCDGSFLQVCTKAGCAKSDIGDDPF
nr:uncharacterized protein LOC113808108 [Penaeus vannamei]XP_027215280.1 uncharacterized protein LOC113808144 [Penaeus vannamei]